MSVAGADGLGDPLDLGLAADDADGVAVGVVDAPAVGEAAMGLAVAGGAGASRVASTMTIKTTTSPEIVAIAMFRCWTLTTPQGSHSECARHGLPATRAF
jgi:hypothetical protein